MQYWGWIWQVTVRGCRSHNHAATATKSRSKRCWSEGRVRLFAEWPLQNTFDMLHPMARSHSDSRGVEINVACGQKRVLPNSDSFTLLFVVVGLLFFLLHSKQGLKSPLPENDSMTRNICFKANILGPIIELCKIQRDWQIDSRAKKNRFASKLKRSTSHGDK